nr:14844_t:CDS:2 [Entrophospora candida]
MNDLIFEASKSPTIATPLTPFTSTPITSDNKAEEEEDDAEEYTEIRAAGEFDWQMHTRTKEELKLLLDNFSEDQLKRYEVYRRSALSKPNVRRLVSQILGQPCSHNMGIVVAGFTKVFVGEIVEKALDVKNEKGEVGALTPVHLREAFRRYKNDTGFESHLYQKRLFNK